MLMTQSSFIPLYPKVLLTLCLGSQLYKFPRVPPLLKLPLPLSPPSLSPLPLDQVVMLENSGELFQHLQVSQVTSDLGGTIRFNHQEWIDTQRVGSRYSLTVGCRQTISVGNIPDRNVHIRQDTILIKREILC